MERNRWTLSDYLRVGLSGVSSGGLMPAFAEGIRKRIRERREPC